MGIHAGLLGGGDYVPSILQVLFPEKTEIGGINFK